MKLVTFSISTPVGTFQRVGALSGPHGGTVIDLNMAYVALLASRKESRPYRLAEAMVPSTMLGSMTVPILPFKPEGC